MMATDEKQLCEETSKMDVAEEPKHDESNKDADQTATAKEDEESKMEVEVSQNEESPKADVSMETESVPPANKEENVKEDETTNKVAAGEPELAGDVNKPPEKVAAEEPKEVQEKETVIQDKGDELTSTSPGEVKDVAVTNFTQESAGEWDVLGTDDEKEEAGDKKTSGVWMPDVNVIIDLYQKLDKEGVLELQWKCPGRRLPPEEVDEKTEELEKMEKEIEKPEAEEEKQEEEPTEFDFDVEMPSITSMAPRRTPGSGQSLGSRKKPVARMDKIFNDMLRHKRIDEELARVGDESEDLVNSRTETTPQRPVGKFRIRKDF